MNTYKKDNQHKKPEHKFSTYEEFSKRWRGFLKGANIENWKDDYMNYLMEKYSKKHLTD